MATIKFGTDGWRAVIAEDFTFANVERVAQAAASYWKRRRPRDTRALVVVGYDRRFLSDGFAACVAEVLAGNGFEVVLTSRPTSTPAVSFAVKSLKACGGVMITASHNPPRFNGFKLKAFFGGSAEPEMCQAIEKLLDAGPVKRMSLKEGQASKRIQVKDVTLKHYAAIRKLVDFNLIAASGIRFAHDALFGVGAGCFEEILEGTTCQVTTLNGEHDPSFKGINPEPIPRNYQLGAAYLKKNPHDVCLVTDGDADRVGAMDGLGNPISTHQLICLLIRHLVKNRKWKGKVVKALSTTSMVERMGEAMGFEVVETGVGFKYVCEEMRKGEVILGAEESGGIGFLGHIPERDGILAGLMLLELLATEKKPVQELLAELDRDFGIHRYARTDLYYPLDRIKPLLAHLSEKPPKMLLKSPLDWVNTKDGVKLIAQDGTWLMVRGSGTEPVLRVYAEARSESDAEALVKQGEKLTRAFKG